MRLHLNSELHNLIQSYCEWAQFESHNEFFEQAAEFVLKKDRDWKQHLTLLDTQHDKQTV